MRWQLATFVTADDGTVTVDWVVLTAGIVGFALFAIISMMTGEDPLVGILIGLLDPGKFE